MSVLNIGFNRKGKRSIVYPNLRSAMSAVPHSTDIPVPQAPLVLERNDTIISEESVSSGDSFVPETVTVEKPHLITQPELNDLVRDLTLTKQQSELLASRLGEWNLLDVDVRISSFRKRSSDLEQYFAMENNLCFCKDIPGLFDCLDLIYDPSQWRFLLTRVFTALKAFFCTMWKLYR